MTSARSRRSTWDGELEVDEDRDDRVVTAGDGDEVAEGDQVSANIWIGNGTTQKKAYSTYDARPARAVTASADLSPVFKDAILGQTVGSRVAVTATAADAFGESGNPQLGIGNKDTVLIVVDLIGKHDGARRPAGRRPVGPGLGARLIEGRRQITGLDFTGTPEAERQARVAHALIEGDGAKVKKGQTITVNYLGQVYDAKKPFDESYSRPAGVVRASASARSSAAGTRRLVGATVGSRVILAIPPADGYGDQGNEQAGIKGTDTLYFVVDILAAS